jgi:hypothetical protein
VGWVGEGGTTYGSEIFCFEERAKGRVRGKCYDEGHQTGSVVFAPWPVSDSQDVLAGSGAAGQTVDRRQACVGRSGRSGKWEGFVSWGLRPMIFLGWGGS